VVEEIKHVPRAILFSWCSGLHPKNLRNNRAFGQRPACSPDAGYNDREFHMSVTLRQNEDSNLIHLDGSVDISCAVELKSALLEALQSGKAIRVSLEDAAAFDLTAVQLLWAGAREAANAGVAFKLAGQAPEAFSSAIADCGFQAFLAS
jgi:anti-anti-sigma regulatory factor